MGKEKNDFRRCGNKRSDMHGTEEPESKDTGENVPVHEEQEGR